jgi:hypothetical protein
MKPYCSFMAILLSAIVIVGVLTAEADVAPTISTDRAMHFMARDWERH